jgi:hypothetical protein
VRTLLVALAIGATGITVTTLPRPPFPGPVTSAPDAKRLVVVSSRTISPGLGGRAPASCDLSLFSTTPRSVRGLPFQRSFCPGGTAFAFYGRDGASSRILLGGFGRQPGPRYGFDFVNYVWPPHIRPGEREFVYEELMWAREAGGVLYVQNGHLTYARSSYGQNAYVTAIDPSTGRRLWRSKALVGNAGTFSVTPRYLVTGYGFTAEDDWLYLLNRKTGRVVERLKLPSGPERITKSGDRFIVRTYDHVIVVKLREP